MTVPRNVGSPAIRPIAPKKSQEGRSVSPASGAVMPKPSVALCTPNPMISRTARLHLVVRGRLANRESGQARAPGPPGLVQPPATAGTMLRV